MIKKTLKNLIFIQGLCFPIILNKLLEKNSPNIFKLPTYPICPWSGERKHTFLGMRKLGSIQYKQEASTYSIVQKTSVIFKGSITIRRTAIPSMLVNFSTFAFLLNTYS